MQGSEIPPSLSDKSTNSNDALIHAVDLYRKTTYPRNANGSFDFSANRIAPYLGGAEVNASTRKAEMKNTLMQNSALLIARGVTFDCLLEQIELLDSPELTEANKASFTDYTLKALDVLFMQRLHFAVRGKDGNNRTLAVEKVIQEFKQIYKQAEEGGLTGAKAQFEQFKKESSFPYY